MKKLIILLVALSSFQPLYAQRNLIPKFIRKMLFEKDSSKSSSFFILPVLSSAPETGIEAGGSLLYSFYTDTLNPGTRVSNIFAYGTLTTKGQSRLSLSSNYWAPANRYHYTGQLAFINFPFDYFGIGNDTRKADRDRLGQKQFRLKLTAEKRLSNTIYAGLVGGGLNFTFTDRETGGIYETLNTTQQPGGGTVLYLGPSFILDSRNNNTYTTKGAIVTTYFQFLKGIFDINDYKGGLFNIEYAQFFSLGKKLVLGLNIQEESLVGERAPFFMLPALGNDEIMRGYYNGRFRDRNLIAGQTELRYRLSDRLGLAAFMGAGEVFNKSFTLDGLKPNFGGGGRYFFDVEKGLSMRVDVAFGEKRPGESRQSGIYMSLSEAF